MKPVEAYQTNDGNVFMNALEAKNHEADIEFEEFYKNHKLSGVWDNSEIPFHEMREWLVKFQTEITEFLQYKE